VCTFRFAVADVPGGKKFYGVEISSRGVLRYTEKQMRAGLALSIG
jgi:hypothetical protein